jgi:hypothetical protein
MFHVYVIVCVSCGIRDKIKEYLSYLPWMSYKATKELITFASEIDCDQTAMGLPPVTTAVLLTAK